MATTYSVIVPVYNGESVLEKTILSAINQTVTPYEIIIIDDASTDRTYELMQTLSSKYPVIKIYQNDKNLNVAATRNKGFLLATGDYIALLDADDCWKETKIEKQIELMQKTNCDFSYTGYTMVDVYGNSHGEVYQVPEKLKYEDFLKENYIGCATVLMRKDIAKTYKMNSSYKHEDYVFWLQLLKDGKQACGINEPLMEYRVSPDSRSGNKIKAAKNRWIIYRKYLQMDIFKASYYFFHYAFRAFKKHR